MFLDSLLPEMRRIVTFVLIGVFNTGFDFILWHNIVKFVKPDSAFEKFIYKIKLNKYSFAQGLAFVIANIVSYFLNRNLAFFDSKVTSTTKTMGSFFLVSLFSLAISVTFMNFMTKNETVLAFAEKLPGPIRKRWPIVAKLSIAIVTMTTNYLGYKIFVF